MILRYLGRMMQYRPSTKTVMRTANLGGVAYFWIMCIIIFCVQTFHILPRFHSEAFIVHFAFGMVYYVMAEMFLNYFLCLYMNSFFESWKSETADKVTKAQRKESSATVSKNWGYCMPCMQYYPPRAHHCPVCKRCILKRDIHCFVMGVCLGHKNMRFFLIFTFYCSITLFCSGLFTWLYLSKEYVPVFSADGVVYIYPVTLYKWVTGSLPHGLFGMVTLVYVIMMLCLGSAAQFTWHFSHVLQGRTSHEADDDIASFDQGVVNNLIEVFGEFWYLSFILPYPLHLSSDGIYWKQQKQMKGY